MRFTTTLATCLALIAGAGAAAAQGSGPAAAPPPVQGAGNPAADTRSPGATATEAVTNPALVPPGAGPAGTGAPPGTGGPAGGPAALPGTVR